MRRPRSSRTGSGKTRNCSARRFGASFDEDASWAIAAAAMSLSGLQNGLYTKSQLRRRRRRCGARQWADMFRRDLRPDDRQAGAPRCQAVGSASTSRQAERFNEWSEALRRGTQPDKPSGTRARVEIALSRATPWTWMRAAPGASIPRMKRHKLSWWRRCSSAGIRMSSAVLPVDGCLLGAASPQTRPLRKEVHSARWSKVKPRTETEEDNPPGPSWCLPTIVEKFAKDMVKAGEQTKGR